MAPPTRMADAPVEAQDVTAQLSNQALQQTFQQAGISLPTDARQLAQLQQFAARRDQEGFMQALRALDISAERASELWLSFLRTRGDSECHAASRAYAQGNRQQGQAWQSEALNTVEARSAAGEAETRHDMQLRALTLMGEGLTQQQRDDMMKGAIGAGFSAGAIFAYQAMMNDQERQRRAPADISDELQLANDNLALYIRDQATQRMQQLRSSQGAYEEQVRLNGEASPQIRQKRDEEAARLARLLGSNPDAVIRVAGSSDADTTIASAWTTGLMNYHMHNLAGTVPVRIS